jgi:D-threo-aldose 1-dehydrogenase
MNPFLRRTLGRTAIRLPQLGFGGAPIATLYGPVTDAQSDATIEAAWDAGIRYFDTAPFYGRSLSEHRIGHVLRSKPMGDPIVSTKVGRVFYPPEDPREFAARERNWPHGLHFEYRHDYGYEAVMRSYEDSLQRLGMNRVEMLIIHDIEAQTSGSDTIDNRLKNLSEGGMRALGELKSAGVIGAIGAGINVEGVINRLLDHVDLDFFLVAAPYTLADQPVLDDEFPRCEKRGIGFVIGQVYASGILATGPVPGAKYRYRDAPREIMDRVGRIEGVCRRHGVPLAAAALQFTLHHPLVASVIPGAFLPEQVTRNVATMQVEIPDDLWRELKHERLLRADAPTPGG